MSGPEKNENTLLECGKIINTHGLAGVVKLESWCNTPQDLAAIGTLYFNENGRFTPKKVKSASVQKKFVLAAIEGIDDIDAAEALKETVVYADRNDVPTEEGEYFIADLIGLDVIDADTGRVYGKISDVFNSGASDIYTVSTPDGERMIPAVDEFVISIDLEKGITVRPIGGMFD